MAPSIENNTASSTSEGHSESPPTQPSATAPLKRSRIQLSCTPCRTAKLKCDRQIPCHQCVKKGRENQCSIPAPAQRKKPAVSMQRRLKHLESLVKDAMSSQIPIDPSKSASIMPQNLDIDTYPQNTNNTIYTPSTLTQSDSPGSGISEGNVSGSIIQNANETAYIGATHWAAILENVNPCFF